VTQDDFTHGIRRWLIRTIWVILAAFVLLLFVLAAVLLANSGVLSGKPLTGEQAKNLWAFLGVALGAVVTLIAALLTEQHNRRTDTLASEAEHRQRIDTLAKVLELITSQNGGASTGGYAPRARVDGAIATLVQFGDVVVGVRVLRELWAAGAVNSSTAEWLISHVLQGSNSPEEMVEAAYVLALQADRLVPAEADPDQDWFVWPAKVTEPWPARLPDATRQALVVAAVRMLLARDIEWWERVAVHDPVQALVNALNDPQERVQRAAARVLATLTDAGGLARIRFPVSGEAAKRIRELSDQELNPWFERYIPQLSQWAKNEPSQLPKISYGTLTTGTLPTGTQAQATVANPGPEAGSAEPTVLQGAHPYPSEWPLTCGFCVPRRVKTAFCPCGVRSPEVLSVPNISSVAGDQPGGGSVTPPARITGHVPAVRLSAGDAAGRVAAAVLVRGIVEGRGNTAAASSARGSATPAPGEAQAFVGGPGADRRAAQRDPARPASQPADDRDAGHGAALASRHCPPALGSQIPMQTARTPGTAPQCPRPGTAPGPRESGGGLPPDPW
jgi:hypothetical protein